MILIRRRPEGQSQGKNGKCYDTGFEVKDGAMRQGMQVALETRKGKKIDSPQTL